MRGGGVDGGFFAAVWSAGVYCRSSCPRVEAEPGNGCFFPSAAAAQQAGLRACERCRPGAFPGSPRWDERADLVARAVRLIGDGVVDREGVAGLAARLGRGARQIERRLRDELGAGAVALARDRRARTARTLIETTSLPMDEVALAAGFRGIRTFDETVREVFARSPIEMRERARAGGQHTAPTASSTSPTSPTTSGALSLRLPFRAPLCPDNLFGHLAATAVPGVEEWRDGAYRRTLRLPYGPGIVALSPRPDHIECRLSPADPRDLAVAVSRCRRMLDLDADPVAVDAHLSADPVLAPLVAKAPGRRVPRTVDADEFAVRAVLGQQVSTAAARTHAARLVRAHGEPIDDPDGGLTHLFPTPAALEDLHGAAGHLGRQLGERRHIEPAGAVGAVGALAPVVHPEIPVRIRAVGAARPAPTEHHPHHTSHLHQLVGHFAHGIHRTWTVRGVRSGHRPSITRYRSPVAGYRSSVVGHRNSERTSASRST